MLGREDLIKAAIKQWGNPTSTTNKGMRFGTHGSKKIEFEGLVWSDFEAGEYGGVVELCKRAGVTENLGNGADDHWHIPYCYRDRNGKLLLQVVRRPNRPRAERFFMRRPDPAHHGEWIANAQGVERTLYRLPELIAADPEQPVFLCEGEKDVDNVRALGCVATCNPGGAGKWRTEFNEFLEDADCVILPDHDDAGEKHATDIMTKLTGMRSLVVVKLPGLGAGEDASDWIGRGGKREELLALVEEARHKQQDPTPKSKLPGYSAAELEGKVFPPLKWVVPNYFPEGLTILAGKSKIGKSWLMLAMSYAVALGEAVLGERCQSRDIIYFALEDTERRMQDRSRQLLGSETGWPHNLTIVHELPNLDQGTIPRLRQYLDERPNTGVIIIDTLAKIRGKKMKDEDQHQCDYRTMAALHDLYRETGISIFVIHHVRKAEADDPLDMILGTGGIPAGADTPAVLYKVGDQARLYIRGRDVEEIHKAMFFDKETRQWTVEGDYEEETTAGENTRTLILTCLIKAGPAGLSPSDIAKETGLNDGKVRTSLHRMKKAGQINRTQYKTYAARDLRGASLHPQV